MKEIAVLIMMLFPVSATFATESASPSRSYVSDDSGFDRVPPQDSRIDIDLEFDSMPGDVSSLRPRVESGSRSGLQYPSDGDLVTFRNLGSVRPSNPNVGAVDIPGIAGKLVSPMRSCSNGDESYRSRVLNGRRYFHPAEDLQGASGATVQSIAPGVVVLAISHCTDNYPKANGGNGTQCANDYNWGNLLVIMHKTASGDIFYSGYHHLGRVNFKVGDRVDAGTAIGTMGSTGVSSGPHLHFEIMDASQTRSNPVVYYRNRSICS